jgi:hypothetical protein
MAVAVAKSSYADLAQNAEMHQLRIAVFGITGLTASAANKIPYATLFPDWNASWPYNTGGTLPECGGPLFVKVNAWATTAKVAPTLDKTNGGTVTTGQGWDNYGDGPFTGPIYGGNVYVLCPSGVTTCELILVY